MPPVALHHTKDSTVCCPNWFSTGLTNCWPAVIKHSASWLVNLKVTHEFESFHCRSSSRICNPLLLSTAFSKKIVHFRFMNKRSKTITLGHNWTLKFWLKYCVHHNVSWREHEGYRAVWTWMILVKWNPMGCKGFEELVQCWVTDRNTLFCFLLQLPHDSLRYFSTSSVCHGFLL